jgi:hypothetical protein
VLGWYSTGSKPGEEAKEFYMRPIYHYNKYNENVEYKLSDADKHLYNGNLDLYIVGGATKEMIASDGLEDRGYGLLQEGATYQIIKITKALGIEEFLKVIKNRIT